uniref:PPPDE domain-containing protein n=1 Tax=Pseudo-nitzschia australis TaxID=44445 RepID=A0A7S4AWV5_9STRA|mmetsp:Transcript_17199/g.37625  ORF Transcript_17199/g.37625 Transcript_17199/m.37625 type:complete len:239 (+) Transcript_17199:58-774(+)
MGEENNIVLNIYELPMSTPDNEQPYGSIKSFFSRILPSTGFGVYHTSIDVNDNTYSFAVGGVTKISVSNKHRNLPPQALFKESIVLGSISSSTTDSPSDTAQSVQKCLDYLKQNFFTPTGYHLAYRNCNHFTETLATALIVPAADLVRNRTLKSYPSYINRLARTGSIVLDESADKTEGTSGPCDVTKEARAAMEINENSSSKTNKASSGQNGKQRKQKKELSEAQKKILAKLKSPKK